MTPNRAEVEEHAELLWRREHRDMPITPEVYELKESGYLQRAQVELMRSEETKDKAALEQIRYALREELRKIEEDLGEKTLDPEVQNILEEFRKRIESKSYAAQVLDLFYCRRCRHTWDKRRATLVPKMCPRCKSLLWNVEKIQVK